MGSAEARHWLKLRLTAVPPEAVQARAVTQIYEGIRVPTLAA